MARNTRRRSKNQLTKQVSTVLHKVFFFFATVDSSSNCWTSTCQSPALPSFASPSCEDLSHGSHLAHVPVSFSKNKVHKDSASFGLIKEFFAHRTMRIHSETCRRTPTKPTVRESLPQRARCLMWTSRRHVHAGCCVHDVPDCQRNLLTAVAFLQLPEVYLHRHNAIEQFGVRSGHLCSNWRLLEPTAHIAREIFHVLY